MRDEMDLQFDHIIHYVTDIAHFEFPGDVLTLHKGGRHMHYGTENMLSYTELSYIEVLSVFDAEKLKKVVKQQSEKHAFPAAIVQDHFKQGFKNICLRTSDIAQVKETLTARGITTIGPVDMSRENKRGESLKWKLLYIDDTQLGVRAPFIIEWHDKEATRIEMLEDKFQPAYHIAEVHIGTKQLSTLTQAWQQWFDMTVDKMENGHYTLTLPESDVRFIVSAKDRDAYDTLVIEDDETMTPYLVRISGANYRFRPNVLESGS